MTAVRHPSGYTLVELLIVCVLLGILTGMAVPHMRGFARASAFRYAERLLVDDLNRCAREARTQGELRKAAITADAGEYVCGDEKRLLPQGVVIESTTRLDGAPLSGDSVIRFLPDGRCDAVRIVLTDRRRKAEIVNQAIGGLCRVRALPGGDK